MLTDISSDMCPYMFVLVIYLGWPGFTSQIALWLKFGVSPRTGCPPMGLLQGTAEVFDQSLVDQDSPLKLLCGSSLAPRRAQTVLLWGGVGSPAASRGGGKVG